MGGARGECLAYALCFLNRISIPARCLAVVSPLFHACLHVVSLLDFRPMRQLLSIRARAWGCLH